MVQFRTAPQGGSSVASVKAAEYIQSSDKKVAKCLVDTDTCFINNTDLDRANKKLL